MNTVVPLQPVGWVSGFMVDAIIVKTVDVYTYYCTKCECLACEHTAAVYRYVESELDKYMHSIH